MPRLVPSFVQPNLYLKSVLDLQLACLQRFNIRALLLDVDCTLKNHGSPSLNDGVMSWIDMLRTAEIQLCLLSNGRHHRIQRLAKQLDLPFVAKAFKPLPFRCWSAINKLGVPRQHAAVVGDQIFADVMAGRLAGLFTVLVCPTSPVEPWFTRLKRPLERRVLAQLDLVPNVIQSDELATTPNAL